VEAAMTYPYDPAVKPGKWLGLAIASTMFCCTPLGIVGIVFAAIGMSAQNRGDYYNAEVNTAKARTWTMWSFWLGLVVVILAVCLSVSTDGGYSY
jgi:hypothetical protein